MLEGLIFALVTVAVEVCHFAVLILMEVFKQGWRAVRWYFKRRELARKVSRA